MRLMGQEWGENKQAVGQQTDFQLYILLETNEGHTAVEHCE